jgi:hypothetical protein
VRDGGGCERRVVWCGVVWVWCGVVWVCGRVIKNQPTCYTQGRRGSNIYSVPQTSPTTGTELVSWHGQRPPARRLPWLLLLLLHGRTRLISG